MTQQTRDDPDRRVGRPAGRDGAAARGTSGGLFGTSGARFAGRTGLGFLAVALLVSVVNVLTELDDARRAGIALPVYVPVILEATSAVGALTAVWVIVAAVRIAPFSGGPPWRTIGVHALGSVAYSGLHVALMTLLRLAAFAAIGRRYPWSLGEAPYEYRKDLVTYLMAALVVWLLLRPATQGKAAAGAPAAEAGPATFDIHDGAALVRAPVTDILAAQAAGNYVEFTLADGRRPLMRASLAGIEARLAAHGFVRTHRSWLVNPKRVRALTPAGSGDFRVDLGCGLTAPLSRRYPEALARLRGGREA